MNRYFLTLILVGFFYSVSAQTGTIAGLVIDESNKEPLIGATILIEGQENFGAAADIDGRYILSDVPVGIYNVIVRYVSYNSKTISEVKVVNGEVTTLDVTLTSSDNILNEVIVTTTFRQENINSVLIIQKNNIAISDGISKDIIQRSPDKNTGEVLKRMSGTTLIDGKFVVIRGLSDRYNTALINGNVLPSTEPDKKTFAFDLFPSALLDNLFIYKTAQPDLPGDFAGGIIQVNTRDIPDENFLSVSAGTGINFQTTFKNYYAYQGGKKDWLGIDDGTRDIPTAFPSAPNYNDLTTDQQIEATKLFVNNWGAEKFDASPLDQSYQISGGLYKPLGDNSFGLVAAITYNNSRSTNYIERNDFDAVGTAKYNYLDTAYKQNILWGSLFNATFKLGTNHKFSLKNSYSINANDNTTLRNGISNDFSRIVDYEYYEFVSNQLLSTILSGEHFFTNSKAKIKWSAGVNTMQRDQPNLRTSLYYKNLIPAYEGDTLFQTFAFTSATPDGNFQFWSYLEEKTLMGNVDFSYPFKIKESDQSFKIGTFLLSKDRTFDARLMGMIAPDIYTIPDYASYLTLPRNEIFNPEYIADSLFYIQDVTTLSDAYTATQDNTAFYAMLDNTIGKKVRIIWGVRAEMYAQHLESFFRSFGSNPEAILVDTTQLDILPSINIIYSLTDKFNIRAAGSKTVVRPELRELAPFGYYDYELSSFVIGNQELLNTDIYNADLRLEYYPGMGQIISASVFYKYFINPIEIRKYTTGYYQQMDPINEEKARNYGVEFEIRKNFSFISDKTFFQNLSFNANLAYINSLVNVTDTAYYGVTERPLQGQSPYVINGGITYFNPTTGFSISTLYNVIGRRISELGYLNYSDIYENPRPLLDAQISIPVLKQNGMFRINCSDILSKDLIYYQDIDESGAFEETADNVISRFQFGSKISASFSYKF